MNDPAVAVTTVEPNAMKPQVEPYEAKPLIELNPGVVACTFCGNNRFRRSRLRFHDLRELFLLRYPVRCTRCSQRQYNDYAVAGLAVPPKVHGPRVAQGNETWKSWTEQEGGIVQRPMSTAVGTRARRLEALNKPVRPAPPAHVPPRSSDDSIW